MGKVYGLWIVGFKKPKNVPYNLPKISISVDSYDKKTAENYRNCYVAEERIISKLSKISIKEIEDLNERCVKIVLSEKYAVKERYDRVGRAGLSF